MVNEKDHQLQLFKIYYWYHTLLHQCIRLVSLQIPPHQQIEYPNQYTHAPAPISWC